MVVKIGILMVGDICNIMIYYGDDFSFVEEVWEIFCVSLGNILCKLVIWKKNYNG